MPLTRRDFTRLSTLAAASLVASTAPNAQAAAPKKHPAPPQPAPDKANKSIGYCIVGLGRISIDHFMPALLTSQHSKVTALVSGHPEKAAKLAAQYNIPPTSVYSYEQYDRIRDNPAIDAVYIALPNSMHAEYTIRAARAGKHVLCEKPMATTVADSRNMIAACAAANKKLMIAYRCQLEAVNLKAIALIRAGAIGQVQAIESGNGFNIGKGEWRLDKTLGGGGPLMDVGIYSLNAARYLTGEEPQVLAAFSSVIDHDGRFAQVEENLGWTMRFPSGILTSCNTSYGAQMDGYYRVHGSKGMIELSPAFGYQGIHMSGFITDSNGQRQQLDMPEPGLKPGTILHDPEQFTIEGDYFSDCILNNKPVKMSGEEGLRDMELIMQIYRSAGIAPVTAPVYPMPQA
jgi:predicted dehydrogenase